MPVNAQRRCFPTEERHHGVQPDPRKYAEHYLAAFAYCVNRRFDLHGLVASLIVDVVRAKPAKKSAIRMHAETRF